MEKKKSKACHQTKYKSHGNSSYCSSDQLLSVDRSLFNFFDHEITIAYCIEIRHNIPFLSKLINKVFYFSIKYPFLKVKNVIYLYLINNTFLLLDMHRKKAL